MKEAEMSQATTVPPFVNNAMKFVLRSPVHKMVSDFTLLLTFTGRKSGKTYTTPVSYSQFDDQIYIFTHASWWKNLCGGATVTLTVRGQEFKGWAEPVAEDKDAITTWLAAHLRNVPSDARYYSVTFDENGHPKAEEVEKAVQTVTMIRAKLY
jgi:deazaflavin-dependent oxidoreductase (nitroreductase family)